MVSLAGRGSRVDVCGVFILRGTVRLSSRSGFSSGKGTSSTTAPRYLGPRRGSDALLQHCVRARRAEALALLDQHPSLLNLRWAGAAFDFQHNGGVALPPSSTVLITASQGEDLALVRELLERGADLHARDGYNWTALHSAAFLATSPEVCELLLSRGIELMAKNTPL